MRSRALRLDPVPSPRLAAAALAVHLAAAASPWVARVPVALAVPLSLLALAGLAVTLSRLPGRHHPLAEVAHDGSGWRLRRAGSDSFEPAELSSASRAHAGLVLLELRAARGRHGWLLPRASLPPEAFRRLKARVRLTC
jgi:hypothetical protein